MCMTITEKSMYTTSTNLVSGRLSNFCFNGFYNFFYAHGNLQVLLRLRVSDNWLAYVDSLTLSLLQRHWFLYIGLYGQN
jgi:hypothetical protein